MTPPGDGTAVHRAVRSYLDHLTVERALAVNTLASYRRDLLRYADELAAVGITDLAGVAEVDVAEYLARLREGDAEHRPLAKASAARAISAVRGLHRFALREGLTDANPSSQVRPPALPRRLPKALDVDQVAKLLTGSAEPGPLGLRNQALLEFLYGTGARISEAIGATVDDLDLVAGVVTLHGKGGRTRVVPVGSYACQALDAYLVRARPALVAAAATARGGGPAAGAKGGGTVFLNSRGGRLSRQSAWTILREAAARAGVPASPHTLRHSYATHLLDGGADIRVVQELLGHASVTTTQVYTLVTVERLREVYATSHPRARHDTPDQ